MTRARVLKVEPSRDDGWGIPYRSWSGRIRALRRAAVSLVAVTALVVAAASAVVAIVAGPDPGLEISADGTRVDFVSPAGFAWREGVRAGQEIVSLPGSDPAGGWRLQTRLGSTLLTVNATTLEVALRGSLPVAVTATLLGGLAVVLLRGRRRWVTAAACLSLAAAVPSLQLAGNIAMSSFAMGAAALAPAVWLAWRPRLPVTASLILSTAAAVFIVAWLVARLWAAPSYDQLAIGREVLAFLATTAVVLGSVVSPVLGDLRAEVRRPRLGDTLLVAISAGLAFGLVAILSPVVAGALLLGAVLLVPAWRRWFAGRAERMLLSDLREQARLDAAEAERAHLARELHDVPLQQLAGIIRRLELLPEARAESDELRTVAEQLRGVATELRPPVLDDLGLAPALEFLAEAASTDEVAVVAEVGDRTCLEAGGRPPPTVELAVFRVAQEAVTNALRHAAPTQVRLAGEVAADRVTLAIIDDGRGLDEAEARAAGRRGRLGLASMRRRAEAIEAELDIHGSEKGTRVAIRWTR